MASEPECVSINMPNTGNMPNSGNTGETRGINWDAICRSFDSLIVEPCETLTSSDGYTLTNEGQRVFLVCIGGSRLAMLINDPEHRGNQYGYQRIAYLTLYQNRIAYLILVRDGYTFLNVGLPNL